MNPTVGAVIIIALVVLVSSGLVRRWFARWRIRRIEDNNRAEAMAAVPVAVAEDVAAHLDDRDKQQLQRFKTMASQPLFGMLFGADNRLSTSRTIACLWTALVAYMAVHLILTWSTNWPISFQNVYPIYLLLLGGPYASLVLAKAVTSYRVSSGSLSKPSGDGTARLSDIFSDDSGRPDIFDGQYVLFNGVAMLFVLVAFARDVTVMPSIPDSLLLLTGGPAAVYLSNKLLGSDKLTIQAVSPGHVTEGDVFVVRGQQFLPGQLDGKVGNLAPQVLVNGLQARSSDWSSSGVVAVAPDVGNADGTPLSVQIVSASGKDTMTGAIVIDCRPRIEDGDLPQVAPGSVATINVTWPAKATPQRTSLVRIGGLVLQGSPIPGPGPAQVTFTLPGVLPADIVGPVDLTVKGSGPESEAKKIEVKN